MNVQHIKKILQTIPLPRAITGVMMLFIVITLLQGISSIKQARSSEFSVADPTTSLSQVQLSQQLIQQIPQWHLFGIAPIVPDNLTQTRLQLTLNGVMMNAIKAQGFAIISAQGADQKLYRIGDSLPGGATLYQIDSKGVILEYNGELQQLPLLKPAP